jgi:(E)-4-hydroxy-3-methylbut-2-enyl-diphosphate synthase
VKLCKELGRAMRIGTNHGSLSDRIMNRFGDSPLGMVESALEFARIARKNDFHNFKFSMKSSNPKVMIECYRLLVARLEQEGPDWNYPIHLGVTEAGEGEDGRIKSAIGIGSLLCDGLGDTIRVSLTEDSPREIEVCRDLLAQIPVLTSKSPVANGAGDETWPFDPFVFSRRPTLEINLGRDLKCGSTQTVRVVVTKAAWEKLAPKLRSGAEVAPEAVYEELDVLELDPTKEISLSPESVVRSQSSGNADFSPSPPMEERAGERRPSQPSMPTANAGVQTIRPNQLVTVKDGVALPSIAAFRLLATKLQEAGCTNPILLKDCLCLDAAPLESRVALLRASVVIGALLADGIGDAILIRGEANAGQSLRLAYNLLQAAGCRSFKTDYVACPSCGRTLFNLQTITARIKSRTEHLKGVKIAIMGCIVNGPGEMADADFGYVGGAPGKINLYVGKTAVRFNIPEAEAVDRLVDLIKDHGKWSDPTERAVSATPAPPN